MTAALERSEWSALTPRPHFTSGKDPVPIVQEAGWAPGLVWTGEKSRPHRDLIPDRRVSSQSLYRLSYPAHKYTGCPRMNVPDFGRVFFMLKYTDITQNTYIKSWTVTEIMAREKWGLLAVPNTATCTADTSRDNANVLDSGTQCSLSLRDALRSQPCYVTAGLSHV